MRGVTTLSIEGLGSAPGRAATGRRLAAEIQWSIELRKNNALYPLPLHRLPPFTVQRHPHVIPRSRDRRAMRDGLRRSYTVAATVTLRSSA